jgi:hypothetical protein
MEQTTCVGQRIGLGPEVAFKAVASGATIDKFIGIVTPT